MLSEIKRNKGFPRRKVAPNESKTSAQNALMTIQADAHNGHCTKSETDVCYTLFIRSDTSDLSIKKVSALSNRFDLLVREIHKYSSSCHSLAKQVAATLSELTCT